MWRKLLKYRELAKYFVKMEVGNGAPTLFWYDHWSSMGRIIDVTWERWFINFGIQRYPTMEHVIQTHRKKRYRSEILIELKKSLKLKGESSLL